MGIFDLFMHTVDDVNGELEQSGVEAVRVDKHNDIFVDNIDFKVLFICYTTKGVAENTGTVVMLDVGVELVKVTFRDCFTNKVFGVDKNSRFIFFNELNITRVGEMGGIKDFSIRKGFGDDIEQDAFSELTLFGGVVRKVFIDIGEAILDRVNFVSHGMSIERLHEG